MPEKSPRRANSPRRRATSRWPYGLLVAVLVGLAVTWFSYHRRPPEPPPVVALPDIGARDEHRAESRASTSKPGLASGALPPDDPKGQTDEERFLDRMAETKKVLLEKTRYPIESRPLVTKTDLLQPHHVEPTMRGLSGDPTKSHGVLITQNQDRVWLSPGQPAVATITATQNGAGIPVTVLRSDLTTQLEDDASHVTTGPVVGNPSFHDDGVPPDALAGDGVTSAAVVLPPGTSPGAVMLSVDVQAGGEQGTLLFNFVVTAGPPAVFTQTARDALEQGSVAVYVGIQVQQAGLYEVVGRLYDASGLPLVFMRFLGDLTADSTEVRLLGFGKVILDEGGVPPFVLKDVEGSMMLIGQYPDRAPMAEWPCGYTTASYALAQLSSADYDGPDKQRKIEALDQATRDGLANIRATAPTAGSGPVDHGK